ncbi:hypothetical protein DSM25559_0439 [Agrobacterium rosae]|uniref:Uncharacterized protein n=1 Tax=Agrobacterium rosae TaxID=1972867 RepID=A0A1R3TK58_9HYPH|nr:hypothetical protein DSM25559_0439 [Agrobacterium rosae]
MSRIFCPHAEVVRSALEASAAHSAPSPHTSSFDRLRMRYEGYSPRARIQPAIRPVKNPGTLRRSRDVIRPWFASSSPHENTRKCENVSGMALLVGPHLRGLRSFNQPDRIVKKPGQLWSSSCEPPAPIARKPFTEFRAIKQACPQDIAFDDHPHVYGQSPPSACPDSVSRNTPAAKVWGL